MNDLVTAAQGGSALVLRAFLPNAAPSLAKQLDAEHRARQLRMGFEPPPPVPTPGWRPPAAPPRALADRLTVAKDAVVAALAALLARKESAKHIVESRERVAGRIYVRDVQDIVAAFYGLTVDDLTSARRMTYLVRPRQIAMFLCAELALRSRPYIGHRFGARDHATVLHAIRKIGELIGTCPKIADDVAAIRAELKLISARAAA